MNITKINNDKQIYIIKLIHVLKKIVDRKLSVQAKQIDNILENGLKDDIINFLNIMVRKKKLKPKLYRKLPVKRFFYSLSEKEKVKLTLPILLNIIYSPIGINNDCKVNK